MTDIYPFSFFLWVKRIEIILKQIENFKIWRCEIPLPHSTHQIITRMSRLTALLQLAGPGCTALLQIFKTERRDNLFCFFVTIFFLFIFLTILRNLETRYTEFRFLNILSFVLFFFWISICFIDTLLSIRLLDRTYFAETENLLLKSL